MRTLNPPRAGIRVREATPVSLIDGRPPQNRRTIGAQVKTISAILSLLQSAIS